MNKIREWLSYWFGLRRVSRQMTVLDMKVESLKAEKIKSDREIDRHRQALATQRDKLTSEMQKVSQSLDRAVGLNKKLDAALDVAREEVRTANDIVIPGLVAASKTLIDRWDAESAVYARRQVAVSMSSMEGIEQ